MNYYKTPNEQELFNDGDIKYIFIVNDKVGKFLDVCLKISLSNHVLVIVNDKEVFRGRSYKLIDRFNYTNESGMFEIIYYSIPIFKTIVKLDGKLIYKSISMKMTLCFLLFCYIPVIALIIFLSTKVFG